MLGLETYLPRSLKDWMVFVGQQSQSWVFSFVFFHSRNEKVNCDFYEYILRKCSCKILSKDVYTIDSRFGNIPYSWTIIVINILFVMFVNYVETDNY